MHARQIFVSALLLALSPASQVTAAPGDATARLEAGERYPGGSATARTLAGRHAFSSASANMDPARKLDFKIGNGFFKRLWVSAPASTQAADGLGPLYNARSCQSCHINNGRGHPPQGPDETPVSLVLHLSVPGDPAARARNKVTAEPGYGTQLQTFSIQGQRAEGRLQVDYEPLPVTLADGERVELRGPRYTVEAPAYGPLDPQAMLSPRLAPQMIGLGLLQAIDAQAILARADPDDRDGDGISGRPNRVWSAARQKTMLGRFGWKAGSATVDDQSQEAFVRDLGISVPNHPNGAGDCTERQTACRQAPDGNSPQFDNLEANHQVTGLVALFSRNLAVPERRAPDSPQVLAGKRLFHASGCIACHTPRHVTREDATDPELAGQTIWPYTDLLLHDMGEGLADGRPEGEADGREWRTPPLWGIGLSTGVNGHSNYLHDGRARNLLEAVLWHGGEAQPARDAVSRMNRLEREQLLRFVESL